MIQRCGYVSVIGRPNVGKSSIINQLAQEKKVITSKRAQTTVFNTTCILTFDDKNMQCILVDTPGINFEQTNVIKKSINKQALTILKSIDLKIWVVDVSAWTPHDDKIMELLDGCQENTLVLLNKIDKVQTKSSILPLISKLASFGFTMVLPHCAHTPKYRLSLLDCLYDLLPEQEYFFSQNDKVMASVDFQVREVIREKCLRHLGQELPYQIVVATEKIFTKNKVLHIYARIDCVSMNHKKMIIGTKGELLKKIGTSSRILLESMLNKKIFLKIWVKSKDERHNQGALLNQLELHE